MPNLTTHIHFGLLFFERTQYDIYLPAFIEGAVTPGFHTRIDTYTIGTSADLDTTYTNIKESHCGSYNFHLGYLSHIFLDHFFDAYRAEIFLFKSPLMEERMRAMSMAEQIDIMHMKKYETDLQSLSEKYGEEFSCLYHAVAPEGDSMEIVKEYENLMNVLVKKFIQFLKALNHRPVSDNLIT